MHTRARHRAHKVPSRALLPPTRPGGPGRLLVPNTGCRSNRPHPSARHQVPARPRPSCSAGPRPQAQMQPGVLKQGVTRPLKTTYLRTRKLLLAAYSSRHLPPLTEAQAVGRLFSPGTKSPSACRPPDLPTESRRARGKAEATPETGAPTTRSVPCGLPGGGGQADGGLLGQQPFAPRRAGRPRRLRRGRLTRGAVRAALATTRRALKQAYDHPPLKPGTLATCTLTDPGHT